MKRFSFSKLVIPLLLFGIHQLSAHELLATKWYLLSAPHVAIIFRGNIDREAQRIANSFEKLYEPVAKSLGTQPSPITMVIKNQVADSNGRVQLSPRKIEVISFPNQDYHLLGIEDWISFLLIHEMRHVAQYSKLNQNFNRYLHWLGGDMVLNSLTGINIPAWFLEGDAVGTETALTKSGRGRSPFFSCPYKANLLEKERFSYYKQTLGSFRDNISVSNDYVLGYYLTTHLRRKYGATVLADILEQTTRPRLFHEAVREVTGKSLLQVYEDTNQELKTLWEEQLKSLQITPAERLNARYNSEYISYHHPQLDELGNVIVLKSGVGTVTQLVLLDSFKKEKQVAIVGNINDRAGVSVARGQILWTQQIPDPIGVTHVRNSPIWKNRSYHVIRRYDTKQKRLYTLTYKSRYGAATLSPDATQIVAFESDESYNHQLVILDATSGQVLRRFPNPNNYYYVTPRWSEDGKEIVVIKQVQQKATITCIDVDTESEQDLLPFTEERVGFPIKWGQYVFYNSPYSGIDNIYAIDLTTHQRYQVTSRAYGAYNPSISADGRWVFFNDFTKDGMDVVKMPLEPQQWTPLEKVEDRSVNYFAPLVTQEDNSDVLSSIPNHQYPTKRYSAWKHWLNIHSWPLLEEVNPRFSERNVQTKSCIYSNSLLNDTSLIASYIHDFRKYTGNLSAKINYDGLYPGISLAGELKKHYKARNNDVQVLTFGLNFPLTFAGEGGYRHQFSLNTEGSLNHQEIDDETFFSQIYQGSFGRSSAKSMRDIHPPWEQHCNLGYSHTPFNNRYSSHLFSATTMLSFPGLAKHHSLRYSVTYLRRVERGTHYRNNLCIPPAPAGLPNNNFNVVTHYLFPICYPDWELGWLLYVKRLRANIFYTFTYITCPPEGRRHYKDSLALEIVAEVNFLANRFFYSEVGICLPYGTKAGFMLPKPTFNMKFLSLT